MMKTLNAVSHLRMWAAALIAALTVVGAEAAPIGSNDVARAMGNWRHRGGTLGAKMGEKVKDVRRVTNGEKAVYIVRFEGGGHLIAPTDTNVRPVIMFSDGDDFDPDPNNPAWDLIGDAPKTVSAAPTSGDDPDGGETDESPSAAKNRAEWAELLDDGNDNAPDLSEYNVDEVRVAPLITTKWSQTVSRDGHWYGTKPCFNYYTPSNYYCGCVATATAQILRKFAYMGPNAYEGRYVNPNTKINGVKTELTTVGAPYDWANMPDVPSDGEDDTEREAVGRLTGDVGIMVGMDYTPDGSGSKTYMGKLVFEKFFGYSSAMAMRGTDKVYTGHDDLFERMFVSNFDAKLPVQIALSGHSILGDGYGYTGGTIYYHLNFGWGWGGYWYNTPADLIKEGSNYTGFVGAVYNIYTNQDYSAETVIASGRVTRNGQAAAGVRVSAVATDDLTTEVASATTDENGIYALFVPAGEYRVKALVEQHARYEISGETIACPLPCVSTIPVENGHYNYVAPDEAEVGNAAHCDIEIKKVEYEPEAEVTIGEVSGQTNFTCATIPVTAKVIHYGQTATSAKVVVTVTPVGGAAVTKEYAIGGDFEVHAFDAAFEGLVAGERYTVTAQVVMNTDEPAGLGDGSFTEAWEFVWFDESASSLSAAKWSGEPVEVVDGKLAIACPAGTSTTFTPIATNATSVRIVANVRECGHYQEGLIPDPDGLAAFSAVLRANGQTELFVWGGGAWHATGFLFAETDANFDVSVDLDFLGHVVRYGVGDVALGTFALPDATGVSSISFKGDLAMSELSGSATDANLVRDVNGTEYANYEAAKEGGATGVLSPLWLSTWNLAGGSGTLDVKDPDGLITFTGASKVLKSETQPDGSERKWYAEANDADIAAGAEKYVKTTVDLGLAKAITDNSVVKIGDFSVAKGSMAFKVEIDDVEVAKAAINDLVEVCGDLDAWKKPTDVGATINFEPTTHVITVTPPAGPCGFVRIMIK